VTALQQRDGPAVMVHLAVGEAEILARITRRAAVEMALAPGDQVHIVLKAMSVARDHIAHETPQA
jgi:molybdate transport system ATP-binding protein